MATLALTFTAGSNAGASLRQLAKQIERAAMPLGDTNPTGASVTLTIDNGPSAGYASVVVAGGGLPTQSTYYI